MKPKIAVVEDEPELVGILEYLLTGEGYDVISASEGDAALSLITSEKPDLVLLDIMLPGASGFDLCPAIRRMTTAPVIVLTARKEQEDIIRGLELGADDYLTKPFNNQELLLRIAGVLSRSHRQTMSDVLVCGDLALDRRTHDVTVAGRSVPLTPTEYNLLLCLLESGGRVLAWESLLREIWGADDWEGGKELVKVNVRRLRKKLEPDPAEPRYVLTVWGVGYKSSCDRSRRESE